MPNYPRYLRMICHWCGSGNDVTPDGPNLCHGCSHRCDLPRRFCDCGTCSTPAANTLTDRAVDELAKWFADRLREGEMR